MKLFVFDLHYCNCMIGVSQPTRSFINTVRNRYGAIHHWLDHRAWSADRVGCRPICIAPNCRRELLHLCPSFPSPLDPLRKGAPRSRRSGKTLFATVARTVSFKAAQPACEFVVDHQRAAGVSGQNLRYLFGRGIIEHAPGWFRWARDRLFVGVLGPFCVFLPPAFVPLVVDPRQRFCGLFDDGRLHGGGLTNQAGPENRLLPPAVSNP